MRLVLASLLFLGACVPAGRSREGSWERPNILFVISDDQSWPHAGVYGDPLAKTPAFDRIARGGVLYSHAFCPASQCGPSRSTVLAGRNIWQLEGAGTQASLFPIKYPVYTDLLEAEGYHVGYTGKPWAPGNWKASGRSRNPAGYPYNSKRLNPPTSKISRTDYAANFEDFLGKRPKGARFCFWFGSHEPHRDYEEGSGRRNGLQPGKVAVPPFYPDEERVRDDLLDYYFEINWFDHHLARMLATLERIGELDRTLIIVTSDNGMPFPRAKATLYEAGTRMPLAIRWGEVIPRDRVIDDLVSFIDLAPTILEAAGVEVPELMIGRSLLPALRSGLSGQVDAGRTRILMGKERHNHARPHNVGYPIRAIRTRKYLYLRNMRPDRWPMGDPPDHFCHTKMVNPTKARILGRQRQSRADRFYRITYAKRGLEELYDVSKDPNCLKNLADDPRHAEMKQRLWDTLRKDLISQGDPRALGFGDVFDAYPYWGRFQPTIGGFNKPGEYNPAFWPRQLGPVPPSP